MGFSSREIDKETKVCKGGKLCKECMLGSLCNNPLKRKFNGETK
jgi:hypothetical protein